MRMESPPLGRFPPSFFDRCVCRLASDGVVQKPGEVTGVGGCGSPPCAAIFELAAIVGGNKAERRLKRRFEADCGGML